MRNKRNKTPHSPDDRQLVLTSNVSHKTEEECLRGCLWENPSGL